MKRFIIICSLMMFLGISFSCKNEVKEEPYLKVSKNNINFEQITSQTNIKVETNIGGWTVTKDKDANWLSAVKKSGSIEVKATKNATISEREATIIVKAGNLSETIKVVQLGTGGSISAPTTVEVGKFGGDITISIMANVPYQMTLPEWITKKSEKQSTESKIEKEYVFSVSKNPKNTPRAAQIVLTSEVVPPTPSIQKEIQIIQKGEYANAQNAKNIVSDIKLTIQRGTATSQQNGSGNIENSYDGNFSTIYHSNWSNQSSTYFPITLEYFLDSPQDVDYMVYHPRTDGYNGHFKLVEIWARTEGGNYVKLKDVDFKGTGKATRVPFDNLKKAVSFKLVVRSGSGDNQGFASAAEIEFWRKNTESFDTASIFTDTSCSELRPDVTKEQLESISNPFFRDIALFMFNKQYPSEFRIGTYRAWANPEKVRQHNRMSYAYSNLDNPTGISVEEGEELVVLVGPTHGKDINIKVQNLDVPNGDGFGNAAFYPLYEGTNKITVSKKGLVYLQYQDDDYKTAPLIKVHFATGKVNGYFDKSKHTNQDWARLLNNASNKYFDVIGEKVHLCFPTQSFRAHTNGKIEELVNLYDDMVKKTHIFAGTKDDTPRAMLNRAYFQVMYTGFMYCTSYRTSYHVSTMPTLCNADKLREGIWGPAHEIGHSHQVGPVFKWIGMTECTVNMNSMNVQTEWQVGPRLEKESMGRYNNRYEKAYNIGIVAKQPFANMDDVFCNLVPFWQLNLYFSKVKQDPEFFVRVYEELRTMTMNKQVEGRDKKDGEYQVDFSKTMSKMTNTDLTNFFERWGFYRPIERDINDYGTRLLKVTDTYANKIKSEIQSSGYQKNTDKIEYICDTNWQYFRDRLPVVKGTASKSGQVVTTNNYQNVVAYEVEENGNLIFVTNKNRFDIGKSINSNIRVYAVAFDGQRTEVTF